MSPPDVSTAEAPASPPADTTEPVRPVGSGGFSMRPAMIVVGLAVFIVGTFIAVGFLTNGPAQTVSSSKATRVISGTSLRAMPAAAALAPIRQDAEPPANIINAVSIPEGAVRISHQNNSAAADQYDEQIGLISNASQAALITFYQRDMKAQGWQIFEVGAADHDPGATEVLGKLAGSDGFYWEMGAVVSATTFGANAPAAGHTDFTVRLFQVPDPD